MPRVAPIRDRAGAAAGLLDGGVAQEQNIISALVQTVRRLVVQEFVEAERGDFLDGRGRHQRRGSGRFAQWLPAGRLRTGEGSSRWRCPRCLGAGEPFRSSVMTFLEGKQRGARVAVGRDVCARIVDAGCGGCVPRRHRRVADPQECGQRDHRPALGPTTRPSSAGTCPRLTWSACFAMRRSRRCAGMARSRRGWWLGASTPKARRHLLHLASAIRIPKACWTEFSVHARSRLPPPSPVTARRALRRRSGCPSRPVSGSAAGSTG